MISAVGLWVSMMHLGGVYNGTTAGELIADILDGVTYTIDDDVAAIPMFGWLPVASARDNLQQVLFAIGASITKTSDGTPRFQFLKNLSTVSLPDERVFLGSSIDYRTPATQIEVTEHSYYKSTYGETVSLYDNADGTVVADETLITFSEPCYDLMWTDGNTQTQTSVADLGWTYGDNYCYVTGVGILSGTKYTHSERTFSVSTGASGETNIKRIEGATLVSPVNSPNVAARVAAYYGKTDATSCEIVLTDNSIKTGTRVSFTDPYDGETETGIVETMDVTLSGNLKADASILKGYRPSNFGNTYKNCIVLPTDLPPDLPPAYRNRFTFSVPKASTKIKIVLGEGGQGGYGGYSGTNGSSGQDFDDTPYDNAGVGGAAGAGGAAGRVFEVEVDTPPLAEDYWIVQAYFGYYQNDSEGGAAEGGEGNTGFVSWANVKTAMGGGAGTDYASSQGEIRQAGFYEVFRQKTYSLAGIDGVAGGDGANGESQNGENVTFEGQTWTGGKVGAKWEGSTTNYTRYAMGGNGGGAAYGSNGGDGGNGDEYYLDSGVRYGGGGNGADAGTPPNDAELGCGGRGGNGGGGGGTGGWYVRQTSNRNYDGFGPDGGGGAGSAGGKGGAGYVIIYY